MRLAISVSGVDGSYVARCSVGPLEMTGHALDQEGALGTLALKFRPEIQDFMVDAPAWNYVFVPNHPSGQVYVESLSGAISATGEDNSHAVGRMIYENLEDFLVDLTG